VERPGELEEVVGAKRLSDNVSAILERLEGELDKVDSRIGESMHVLDLDNDGLVRGVRHIRRAHCMTYSSLAWLLACYCVL
jgi:hypothetical protein